jgi:hypothetical protein
MARIDRLKRALGSAVKRTKPSQAAMVLVDRKLIVGRVLDFGCGHGCDAGEFGWDAYDPYYRPEKPVGSYDTIVCTHVLNALSRNNRAKVIEEIRQLLAENGIAYLAVRRDLPITGKLGIHHSLQNYVVLTLPSSFADDKLELYKMTKTAMFEDKTKDFKSLRDRRRDR